MTQTQPVTALPTSRSVDRNTRSRRERVRAGKPRRWLSPVVLLGAALTWELVARLVGSPFVPPLTEIGRHIAAEWFSGPVNQLFLSDEFISMVAASLRRLVPAFVLGALAGTAIGMGIALLRPVRYVAFPLVHFFRSIPAVAMLPLFIVLLGLGDLMKMWLIGSSLAWPILINVVSGVRSVDPMMRDTLHSYGASAWQRVRWLVIPAMMPHLFAGLRIATMVGLAVMVVTEMYASGDGIGYYVLYSQRRFDPLSMWAGVLALAGVGLLLNGALTLAERRLLAWHKGARGTSS